MFKPDLFFTADQEARIIQAIKSFERRTSGEIRVHIERKLRRPPLDEAARVFEALSMHKTALRNGVLILVAPQQHAFAIFGDEGIYQKAGQQLWDQAAEAMKAHFAKGDLVTGLIEGIGLAGEALAQHFPFQEGDINELPDDISYA